MSAATKRKPLTAGTVKGAGVRHGRRIHKARDYHITKKRRRQIIRRIIWILGEYVRPIVGLLLVIMMFGIIGGMEWDDIELWLGFKMAFKCLIAAALLFVPEMTFFKGGRG